MKKIFDKDTQKVYDKQFTRKFPSNLLAKMNKKLMMVYSAKDIDGLKTPPSNKLHKLYRDREGQQAIWINDKWRVCFIWSENEARRIEITDYH